jgi:anti-anti-sigma factor
VTLVTGSPSSVERVLNDIAGGSVNVGRQANRTVDANRLAVTIETHPEDVVAVRVFGELDLFTTDKLDRELVTACSGGCRTLVLDLGDVSVLDSTGLRALWTIRHGMREIGGRLILRSPSEHVLRVLVAAGLGSLFDIE